MYEVACPYCEETQTTPFVRPGAVVDCPSCGKRFQVNQEQVHRLMVVWEPTSDDPLVATLNDAEREPDGAMKRTAGAPGAMVGGQAPPPPVRSGAGGPGNTPGRSTAAPAPAGAQMPMPAPPPDLPPTTMLDDVSKISRGRRRGAASRRKQPLLAYAIAGGVGFLAVAIVFFAVMKVALSERQNGDDSQNDSRNTQLHGSAGTNTIDAGNAGSGDAHTNDPPRHNGTGPDSDGGDATTGTDANRGDAGSHIHGKHDGGDAGTGHSDDGHGGDASSRDATNDSKGAGDKNNGNDGKGTGEGSSNDNSNSKGNGNNGKTPLVGAPANHDSNDPDTPPGDDLRLKPAAMKPMDEPAWELVTDGGPIRIADSTPFDVSDAALADAGIDVSRFAAKVTHRGDTLLSGATLHLFLVDGDTVIARSQLPLGTMPPRGHWRVSVEVPLSAKEARARLRHRVTPGPVARDSRAMGPVHAWIEQRGKQTALRVKAYNPASAACDAAAITVQAVGEGNVVLGRWQATRPNAPAARRWGQWLLALDGIDAKQIKDVQITVVGKLTEKPGDEDAADGKGSGNDTRTNDGLFE